MKKEKDVNERQNKEEESIASDDHHNMVWADNEEDIDCVQHLERRMRRRKKKQRKESVLPLFGASHTHIVGFSLIAYLFNKTFSSTPFQKTFNLAVD